MKLRAKKVPVVCIMIGLLSLLSGSITSAQMYPQPPILAPYGPTMNMGVFYLNAGVKFRNIQTVRFELLPHSTERIVVQGTVPFGPEQNGVIFYPYNAEGLPGQPTLPDPGDPDPALSGRWFYDNGYVDAASPGINPTDPNDATLPVDSNFGPPLKGLGWYNGSQNSAGSFRISDPGNQANARTYDRTTRILYSRLMDGRETPYETASIGYRGQIDSSQEIEFTNKLLSPYVEAGYRAANFFNVLFGFSWFSVKETYSSTLPGQGYVARRAFIDSFYFRSPQVDPWLTTEFFSGFIAGSAGENPNPAENYFFLFPAGTGTATELPIRTFYTAIDPAIPVFGVQEILSNKLDFTALEFKLGGRSWYPLWGMGEIGTSFGALWSAIPYTVVTKRTLVATASSTPAGVTAGQTLAQISHTQNNVWLWPNIGLFLGADVRLGWGRYFLQSAVEYDVYFGNCEYGDDVVQNVVNLSGVNGTFTVGSLF